MFKHPSITNAVMVNLRQGKHLERLLFRVVRRLRKRVRSIKKIQSDSHAINWVATFKKRTALSPYSVSDRNPYVTGWKLERFSTQMISSLFDATEAENRR